MTELTLKVVDGEGKVLAVSTGEENVQLVYGAAYQEGDAVILESTERDRHLWIQVDDALGASLCLFKDTVMRFPVPFGESVPEIV